MSNSLLGESDSDRLIREADEAKVAETAADMLLIKITGLMLSGAASNPDQRIKKLSELAYKLVSESDAMKTLLIQASQPPPPAEPLKPLSTIGVNALTPHQQALELLEQIKKANKP